MTLKEDLKDWVDIDSACFCLAVMLGIMPNDPKLFRGKGKHVFWSRHDLGDELYTFLFKLIDIGVLTRDYEGGEDRIKWNPDYKGSWE